MAPELVRPVSKDLQRAISLLRKRSAILLSDRDVARFGGALRQKRDRRLRPYLVRAVFPTSNPMIRVSWDADSLFVFAAGLGCSPYVKHPIVVFLDREPKRVFVSASAAL